MPFQNELFPLIEPDKRLSTTQRIDYRGMLTQCTVKAGRAHDGQRDLQIYVKNYESQSPDQPVEQEGGGLFSSFTRQDPASSEKYCITFLAAS